MKRKSRRKFPPVQASTVRPSTVQQEYDAIDALVAASAKALGLTLDPAWAPVVKFNFQLILRHAAQVDEFPLPDEAEPAAIFHA